MIPSINCLHPIWVPNPNWNGSFQNPLDPKSFHVPCGKCELCLSRKRATWFFRISAESNVARSGYFVTLTYSDECLPSSGRVEKRDCQLFLKRLRQFLSRKIGKEASRFRYFLSSEYGETFGRPHYHVLFFGLPSDRSIVIQALKESWNKCQPEQFDYPSSVAPITPASINYVCKYSLNNLVVDDPNKKTFLLCSKGIGSDYLTPHMLDYLRRKNDGLAMVNGVKAPLPRYYRDKVYDDEMKFVQRINQINNYEQNMAQYSEDCYYSDRSRSEPLWKQELNRRAEKIRVKLKRFE